MIQWYVVYIIAIAEIKNGACQVEYNTSYAQVGSFQVIKPNKNQSSFRECSSFHEYSNSTTICDYVTSQKSDCIFEDGYLQYMQFSFCYLPPKYYTVIYVILSFWLMFMFVALGVTAEEFFCPCLKSISKTLHMSDSVAGVTLLALGNGAPDIFSVIAAINNDDPFATSLAFQELFGAGIFVTTVVAGFINICATFKMARRPFLRDVVFYIAAVGWTFAVMYKRDIKTMESIGFIVLYGVYVLIVIVGQFINRQVRKRAPSFRRLLTVGDEESPKYSPDITHIIQDLTESADFTSYNYSTDHAHLLKHNIHAPSTTRNRQPIDASNDSSNNSYVQIINSDMTDSVRIEDDRQGTSLVESLTGISSFEWKYQSIISKVYSILKIGIIFVLSITCPVVDRDVQGEKWNKWLTLTLCVTSPMFCIFSLNKAFVSIYEGFRVWHLIIIVSFLLILVIQFTSSFNTAPKYHFIFAFIGFLVAVLWIKSIAQEIVNLLQTFGWIFGLSYGIMGLTFLAWGNSIGDFISNLTMARHGAPRMAIAACYGGPLLNMLLGIGISCTVSALSNGGHKKLIRGTTQYILSVGFLSVALLSAMILLPANKFVSSRYIGIYLLVLYFIYLCLSILHETDVLHFNINV